MSGLSLLERSMVVFNFLPSKTLHPSRIRDYGSWPYLSALAAAPDAAALWHRHWSADILQREGLRDAPVTDGSSTGLEVAVMQPDALARLVRRIGVALCAPRLRYAISGPAVRALQAALGPQVMHWIREARMTHPGLPGEMFHDADQACHDVDLAGHAALYLAFQSARPEVARRLFLKLPPLPCLASASQGRMSSSDDELGTTAGSGIVHAVVAAIDSEGAMALVMAVRDRSDIQEQG
ncbi:hypothetical protein BOSP111201_24430 [Bordetella sputigena]